MDFHQLKVFREAARAGSFTRSGERLHLSQSTISLHFKKLEQEFGVPLFLRTRRRVELSEAGKRLLPYADRIFHELKNANMAVKELGEMDCGAIRLGSGGTTVTYALPVQQGRRCFPGFWPGEKPTWEMWTLSDGASSPGYKSSSFIWH